MTTFTVVWLGQFVSLLGSGLTSFALGVWVFEHTASITQFSLLGLCLVAGYLPARRILWVDPVEVLRAE